MRDRLIELIKDIVHPYFAETIADHLLANGVIVPPCKVCERITDASKDIFWTFARTHQPEDKDEFRRVRARFCPACGREIVKERKMEPWEEKENRS